MKLKDLYNIRTAATASFTIGQAIFLAKNIDGFDWAATTSTALLTACSFCYPASVKNPKWLAAAGTNLIAAYLIIGATAEGNGQLLQQIGMITPIIQGALLIKAGLSNSPNMQEKMIIEKPSLLRRIFDIPNKYPIATGGSIEAPGVAAVAVGAFASGDTYLGAAASFWVLGNIFLAMSDPALKKKLAANKNTVPEDEVYLSR